MGITVCPSIEASQMGGEFTHVCCTLPAQWCLSLISLARAAHDVPAFVVNVGSAGGFGQPIALGVGFTRLRADDEGWRVWPRPALSSRSRCSRWSTGRHVRFSQRRAGAAGECAQPRRSRNPWKVREAAVDIGCLCQPGACPRPAAYHRPRVTQRVPGLHEAEHCGDKEQAAARGRVGPPGAPERSRRGGG